MISIITTLDWYKENNVRFPLSGTSPEKHENHPGSYVGYRSFRKLRLDYPGAALVFRDWLQRSREEIILWSSRNHKKKFF